MLTIIRKTTNNNCFMVKVGDVTLHMIKLISYFSIVINAFNLYQVITNTDSIEM
jgi:hypothetical protein